MEGLIMGLLNTFTEAKDSNFKLSQEFLIYLYFRTLSYLNNFTLLRVRDLKCETNLLYLLLLLCSSLIIICII